MCRWPLRASSHAAHAPNKGSAARSGATLLGADGVAIPFLRYLPENLGPLGACVGTALRERLAEAPSFEGYDIIVILADVLRSQPSSHGTDRARIAEAWPRVAVEGTRGKIWFSRTPGISVWQWAWAPVQVVDRDPVDPDRFRTRVKDRFDFVAHELGHALRVTHSFGDPAFKDPGEDYGGYAHPYCVKSAMAYGGIGGPYFPAAPRGGRPEYSGLGPSLNATTALRRGWLHARTYDPATAGPAVFTLRSRHWRGRDTGLPPQAVEVLAPGGRNYVYPPADVPVTVAWTVDGEPLRRTSGQLVLSKRVQVANPGLDPREDVRSVVVSYTVEALPAGARLRLANRPDDETFCCRRTCGGKSGRSASSGCGS